MSEQNPGHLIDRTSPQGPGQKFVGTCRLCGKQGLTFADMNEQCPNPSNMSQDDTLIAAIDGEGE